MEPNPGDFVNHFTPSVRGDSPLGIKTSREGPSAEIWEWGLPPRRGCWRMPLAPPTILLEAEASSPVVSSPGKEEERV